MKPWTWHEVPPLGVDEEIFDVEEVESRFVMRSLPSGGIGRGNKVHQHGLWRFSVLGVDERVSTIGGGAVVLFGGSGDSACDNVNSMDDDVTTPPMRDVPAQSPDPDWQLLTLQNIDPPVATDQEIVNGSPGEAKSKHVRFLVRLGRKWAPDDDGWIGAGRNLPPKSPRFFLEYVLRLMRLGTSEYTVEECTDWTGCNVPVTRRASGDETTARDGNPQFREMDELVVTYIIHLRSGQAD
ncbi:hypothetical protein HDU93_001099 [Gonapodya sp. JEL0774]|nr:hypothetical protein HDU93_001099 [Gonapodya sp. JEL0774]